RSGAIALPTMESAGAGGRLQRFLRRFTSAPSSLFGQVRRKSAAVLGGHLPDEASQLELTLFARRPRTVSLASLVQRTRFTSQELKAIYRRFKSECPYGLMQEEVLERILAQIFPLGNAHTFAHFVFCGFDRGRTGSVSFEQFALCLNTLLKGSREERLGWIFNMYDTNKDGEINRREVFEV
uniref:EF-hand domain-containing protein n=1 Tax=Macrostomum lignano TaxID=282301 RepID=A0A1I8GUW2_9PLAT